MKKKLFSIPNTITLSRLLFGIGTFFLILFEHTYAAVSVYTIGALTDTLDGKIARKLKKTSKFGGLLDALVDRVFIVLILIALLIKGYLTLLIRYIILGWIVAEIVVGIIITRKTKKFYLEAVHRNSIRIFAFFVFLALGWKIIKFPYLENLFWVLFVLGAITLIDYAYWIAGKKWKLLEKIEKRCKKIPVVNIFFN